jgi:DNA sulfur modification protein DndD
MRFIKIELYNYRPYRGKCQIEFPAPESHKNFYIIMGKNGTGKTSILNAIHWCLYDEEAERKTGVLLNNSIASEMSVNDFKEVKVDLYLQDDEDDLIYWVSRSKQYQKTKDESLFGLDSRLKISTSKKSGGGFVENPFPEAVASIIPAGIKRFFIFNGEELKSFFGLNGPKEVYDAVLDVSQIDLLTKTLSHLNSINAEEAKDVSGSSEADSLSKQLTSKIQEITEQTDKIRKKSGEIEQNRIKLNELKDFLKKSNSEVIKERQARMEAQNSELKRITKARDDLEMTRADLVIKNLPFIYLDSSLKKVDSIFSTMVDKGTIPPDINSEFIKELLKKRECICGVKFKSDSKEDKALHLLLHKWESYNEYAATFIDLRPKVSDSLASNKNVAKELSTVGKNIIEYEKDETKISRILESLKPAAAESNASELIRKEREEIALAQGIETELRYLGAEEQTLKQLEKDKIAINTEIDKILDKEVKDKRTKSRIGMYKEATNLIDSIKNDIIEEVQKGIEERTNKYFMQMIWKKDTYKKIGISKDYNISVVDKYGLERVGNMSAGEEQILAFSFMAALKEISGFDAPIVIDTPLGRIAQDQKEIIAESLPNFLEGKQVTMLMTDSEFTPQVRKALESRIARIYEIGHDSKTDSSVVKELK